LHTNRPISVIISPLCYRLALATALLSGSSKSLPLSSPSNKYFISSSYFQLSSSSYLSLSHSLTAKGMAYLHLAHTLADAFNALADEVQTLTDRKTVLEHKLRFAHEQVRINVFCPHAVVPSLEPGFFHYLSTYPGCATSWDCFGDTGAVGFFPQPSQHDEYH
jgi:hypothetical protein